MAMVQREAGFVARPKSGLFTRVAFLGAEARRARPWVQEGVKGVAEKWSARKTLAFIIVVCGAFWAAVAYLLI
jgi:hypothetical protein